MNGATDLDAAGFSLMFYNARWYDPYLNRYIQPDSIVPLASQGTQAWDRYAYVNNNPVRYTDPTGHRYCDYINSQNQEDCEVGQSRFDSSPKGSANATYGNTFGIDCSGKYKSDACLNDAAAGGNLEDILPKDDDATAEPAITHPTQDEIIKAAIIITIGALLITAGIALVVFGGVAVLALLGSEALAEAGLTMFGLMIELPHIGMGLVALAGFFWNRWRWV